MYILLYLLLYSYTVLFQFFLMRFTFASISSTSKNCIVASLLKKVLKYVARQFYKSDKCSVHSMKNIKFRIFHGK